MRSVDVTLSEDDLYRVYMALHEKIGSWERMRADAPVSVQIIVGKYAAVLERIQSAYQECLTEEVCDVGRTYEEDDPRHVQRA